jgi:hypothetical protein
MSEIGGEVQPPQPQEEKATKDLASKGRLIFVLIMFVIELAIFFTGTITPINHATQQALNQTASGLKNATSGQPPLTTMRVIFTNNLRVALIEMLPVVGALVFAASIFTTGQLLQVITMTTGVPGILYALLLFIFPYTIVELSAYALAVVSGSMLVVAWRRKTLRREIRVFLYEIVAVVLILLTAAAMETATLESAWVGIALWIPTVLAMTLLAFRIRRVRS